MVPSSRRTVLLPLLLVASSLPEWQVDAFVPSALPAKELRKSSSTPRAPSHVDEERATTTLCYSLVNPPLSPRRRQGKDDASAESGADLYNQKTQQESTSSASAASSSDTPIPFVIERLPDHPSDHVYHEISKMCIEAFFNDGAAALRKKTPFWKDWQLGYLRTLQQSDLRVRRKKYPDTNMMFVARQAVPVEESSSWATLMQQRPLILDWGKIFNLSPQDRAAGVDYVQGEVLGFVEVTLRPYGLGSERFVGYDAGAGDGVDGDAEAGTRSILLRNNAFHTKRPVLTNLSVKYEARNSGVGSQLMQVCEQQVTRQWASPSLSQFEIILEVEDDNTRAFDFYQKRGFVELFEDPAGRRYDTNGLFLRQLRCCRKVMRKELTKQNANFFGNNNNGALNGGASESENYVAKTLQRLRESFSFAFDN